jgi:ABC-type sugar transport system, permease component
MSFFSKYKSKQDGAIRGFDMASHGVRTASAIIFVICLLLIVCALFPAVWVCLSGFKDIRQFRQSTTIFPKTFDFGVFSETWERLHFGKYYINSLISVVGSTVCAVFFNGLLAYGLSLLKPRGYRVIDGLVMWSMLIPATTSMVSLFVNISRVGLDGSFLPIWLSMGANAFYVILFKQYFQGLPKSLMEAATLDGCGNFKVFYKIVLPLSMPIVAVICIFAVTASWSDFLLPYLVLSNSGKDTVILRLFQFRTSKSNDVDIIRAIVFSIIPPIVIFTIFQKQITQSVVSAGIKG